MDSMTRKRPFLRNMPRSDPQPPISWTRRILRIRNHIVAAFQVAIANKTLRVATALGLAVTVAVAYGIWFDWEWKAMIGWKALEGYINPDPDDTTGKKDAVQVYAVIVAGVIASHNGGCRARQPSPNP